MANLFWKSSGRTRALQTTPFKTEDELEKIVFETSGLIEEVFVLKRQVRGGSKSGIPDIVGMDSDGNVCIIEIKNTPVDARIIPQVLEYALWAEANPDSIKSLWHESEKKPEYMKPTWEDLQVRILVIAPSIQLSTLNLVDKINYTVELIEVKRWTDGKNEFLHVNKLELPEKSKVKPASGRPVYNEKFYKETYNAKSVDQFLKYVSEVESLVKQNGWKLETSYKKLYCGFKFGFFNAFGVKWIGSKTFAFFVKISEEEANKHKIKMTKYDADFKEAVYYIEPGKTKTRSFKQLFRSAHKRLLGN